MSDQIINKIMDVMKRRHEMNWARFQKIAHEKGDVRYASGRHDESGEVLEILDAILEVDKIEIPAERLEILE